MTFWESLKEEILERLFGRSQLQAWRDEKKRRLECDRVMQAMIDANLSESKPDFLK